MERTSDIPSVAPSWLVAESGEQRVEQVLKRIGELCPIPATAQRVMQLTAHENVSVTMVVEALSTDAALAAETIRIANSPLYGQARQVRHLHQAVSTIGLRELHEIASSMGVLTAFESKDPLNEEFHASSVLCGMLARDLAVELRTVNPRTAFLCGLLCEIGAMACLSVDPVGYAKLWKDSDGLWRSRIELETARYSATTARLASSLLRRNHLPQEVCDALAVMPDHNVADMTALQKATLFARLLAPAILRAAREDDRVFFEQMVEEATNVLALNVPRNRLLRICVDAAHATQLDIPADSLLVEDLPDTASIEAPEPGPSPAATRPTNGRLPWWQRLFPFLRSRSS